MSCFHIQVDPELVIQIDKLVEVKCTSIVNQSTAILILAIDSIVEVIGIG